MLDCPAANNYMPDQFAVDFDRTKAFNGPYGTEPKDDICIQKGKCSSDSTFFNYT